MSTFSNIIRLCPIISETHTEYLSPDVTFPCPYCSGNGWHWSRLEGDARKKPCPHCCGSGRVKPKVTITWEPVGSPISIFNEEVED